MERNSQLQQERREERKRRRQRNQIVAYAVLLLLLFSVAAGVVFGVRALTSAKQEEAEQKESKVEEILATEESIEIQETVPQETVPEPAPELTPEQKLDEIVNAGIEVMPLEDKVAGLFMVAPEAITGVTTAVQAGEGTRDALSRYAVGGIVYFSKNIQSGEQLSKMIENTLLYTKYPLFIAVDEEGGSVARVADAGLGTKIDGASGIGQTGNADNAYQAGAAIGGYLSQLGFNLDFAPVADIANAENSIMASRAYGRDAVSVIPYVTAMMQGLEEQKITACLKHFPGIGSSVQDTHNGMASTERTAEEFRAEEFAVFRAGIEAGANMIMVGHMAAPALSGDNTPCSLSAAVVTDILRGELGYDGIVITDALNMPAVSEYYAADEAAVMALRAGCDMLLMPEDFEAAYNGVLKAVQEGIVSEERINDSLRRIYRVKYADRIEQ